MPIEVPGQIDPDAPTMGSQCSLDDIPDQTPCQRLACRQPRWRHIDNALGHEFVEV